MNAPKLPLDQERKVLESLRRMMDDDPGCAETLMENMSQPVARQSWKGRLLATVGGEIIKRRADLGDRFFELFGDRLDAEDLSHILSFQDDRLTGDLALLLLREVGKHPKASDGLVEDLLAHILLEGGRAQDEDLLDAMLGEVDISERSFRGLRGEGNALYLAATLPMNSNAGETTTRFLFRRLVAAGCNLEAPCRHEVRRGQSFDFHSPLAMACACLDVGKDGAKQSIDGLLEVGALVGDLRRKPGVAARYLRNHPQVRAKRMKSALGWLDGRKRKTTKPDQPWRGL